MAFSEELKLTVKKKAHFACCLCHALGVEIHHVVPRAEGGPDTEDNAAPLCPTCHEMYGANSQKRKFIREVRDFWYELCTDRFKGEAGLLDEISKKVDQTVSKEDLQGAIDTIILSLSERKKMGLPVDEKQISIVLPIAYWMAVFLALEPQIISMKESIDILREQGFTSQDVKKLPIEMVMNWSGVLFARGAIVDAFIEEGVMNPEAARMGNKVVIQMIEEELKKQG